MAKRKPASKTSPPRKAKESHAAKGTQAQSLSRSEMAKVRRLLNAKTVDSLKLAVGILGSFGTKPSEYKQIFTDKYIADLVRAKRGQTTEDVFRDWEDLLAALGDIKSLQTRVLRAITDTVSKEGYLGLSNLVTLSDAASVVFSKHDGQLELQGLVAISDTVAEALGRHKGHLLNLNGLTALSGPAAAALARHRGSLWLNGLPSLSDAAAKGLAQHRGEMELEGLVGIPDAVAELLATKRNDLSLHGLHTLSDSAAAAFAKHKGVLGLGGLATLSDSAAASLATHRGPLLLGGLETLSDAAAEALAANAEIALPFKFGIRRAILARIPAARHEFLERHGSSTPFIELVRIPSGSFMMGSPPTEPGRESDETQAKVRITKPFKMSRTVVTPGQWRAVMGSEPWRLEADGYAGTLNEKTCGDQFPAVWIDWDLAARFCSTLTELERETGRLAETQSYRLPTEAEWEYACRAGTTTAYSFGDSARGFGEHGWCRDNSSSRLHKVALKKPNPWGLHDMHGNVWEWCSDWYDTSLQGGDDPTGPASDPGHDINGMVMGKLPSRVLRGGNRYCKPTLCRSAHRAGWGHGGWRLDILVGIRVVCGE